MTESFHLNEVYSVLKTVDDPEIPNVSVYDLGMVHNVSIRDEQVAIMMVPTFAGCPALDIIERDVKNAVERLDWVSSCHVKFSFELKWSTDKITDVAKVNLKKHGIAPPPENYRPGDEWSVNCPFCESNYTSMENVFGPTACRSILYCSSCKNPFEAMKPVIEQTVN